MMRCLAEFDPAAGECLDGDRSTFQALFDPATLAQFERHIAAYAFADAQLLLDAAVLSHGIFPKESSTP